MGLGFFFIRVQGPLTNINRLLNGGGEIQKKENYCRLIDIWKGYESLAMGVRFI